MSEPRDPTLKVLVNINEIIVSLLDKQYLSERDEMDLHLVFATLNDMIKRKSNSDDNMGVMWTAIINSQTSTI